MSACSLRKNISRSLISSKHDFISFDAFEKHGIKLKFLNTKEIIYDQFGQMFQPNLSIIDVMMFNSVEEIMTYLNEFELIEK